MVIYSLLTEAKTIEEKLFYRSTPLVSYHVEYPQFSSHSLSVFIKRLNKYYEDKAFSFRNYCASTLYEEAKKNYEQSADRGTSFNMMTGIFNGKVTYNQKCTLSIYTEEYVDKGGANGDTLRQSDTWNLAIGSRFALDNFIQIKEDAYGYMKDTIALKVKRDTENSYFEDYPRLIKEHFNPKQFYLADDSIVVYFNPTTIAPKFAGITEFKFPYGKNIIEPDCM